MEELGSADKEQLGRADKEELGSADKEELGSADKEELGSADKEELGSADKETGRSWRYRPPPSCSGETAGEHTRVLQRQARCPPKGWGTLRWVHGGSVVL